MECPNCKADIPEGNRFCEACGTPAPIRCPSCGAPTRSGARFCGKCGAALTVSDTAQMRPTLAANPANVPFRSSPLPNSRDLLAPLYGWFTEGFDTQDLKEAIGARGATPLFLTLLTEALALAGKIEERHRRPGRTPLPWPNLRLYPI